MPHPNQPGGVTASVTHLPKGAPRAPVVLVVDDDLNAIQALHAALTPMGVECLFALDGTKAMELARTHRPDLVVLDVQMPGMDGFSVARALQAEPALHGLPIVFSTRHADALTESRALDAGAGDFIAKPYSEPVLRARVRKLLRLKKHADEALRTEAAGRTKAKMLSYLAHEVGNPLNGMLGFSQLMIMDTVDPLSTAQRKRVQQIIACGQTLATLLRDVGDLSRFEAGRLQVQMQPLVLSHCVDRALDAAASQAEAAGVALLQPVDAAGDAGLAVQADPARLHQCLMTLLGNAIQHARVGGRVSVAVRQEARQGGHAIGIEVADDGLGLTSEQQQYLFAPFDRLGHTGAAGQGLGLVVTRTLAQAMGGELAVHSQPGLGSRFTVWLQRASGAH